MVRGKQRGPRFGIFEVCLAILCLGGRFSPLAAHENLPYRLITSSHSQASGFALYDFVDLDGDEIDEIIAIAGPSPDYAIRFYRRPDDLIQLFNFSGPLTADSSPLDIDNDGMTKEYLVSVQIGNRVALFALWPFANGMKELFTMTGPQREASGWSCLIYARDLIDVNEDGTPDLIVCFTSNSNPPGGVIAVDLTTGKQIWQREIACSIRGYLRADLDEDGRPEMLLATASLNSDARTDSTDDEHAYLMILDSHTGAFRYLEPRGGSFTRTYVYPASGFGLPSRQFVLVVDAPQQESRIEVWDWQLRQPVAQLSITAMKWHFVADVNGDQKQDLVFLDHTGNWQAVDVTLQRISSFPTALVFPPTAIVSSLPSYQIPLPIQLPGTSRPGIVAQFSNRAGFIVFDDRLQPAAIWDEGLAGELRRIRRGKQDDLFWATADHVYFLQLSRNTALTVLRDRAGAWMILALSALLGGLALWMWLLRKKSMIISRILQTLQDLKIGALVMQPPDRVLRSNREAREILHLGKRDLKRHRIDAALSAPQYGELLATIKNGQRNGRLPPRRCEVQEPQKQKEIEVMVLSLKGRLRWNRLDLLLLRDVTDLYAARKATFWAKTAQKMAHDLKTPLSTILMAVDHLQKDHDGNKQSNGAAHDDTRSNGFIEHIRSEVARVRKHAIGFMKFAELEKPKFEPLAANELLRDVLSTFAPAFGDHIRLNQELEESLPAIAADAKQMRITLNNLIDNAIGAMPNGGTLTVRTYLVSPLPDSEGSTQESLAIEIQDTGAGIPPDILKSIHEQQLFVTTKPDGTGVGLVQVQEIISDHQGQFEINSTPGVGTVVCLTIPVYREKEHA